MHQSRRCPIYPQNIHEFTLKMPAPCQVCGPPRGYIARHWMDGLGGNQLGRGPVHMAVAACESYRQAVVGKSGHAWGMVPSAGAERTQAPFSVAIGMAASLSSFPPDGAPP